MGSKLKRKKKKMQPLGYEPDKLLSHVEIVRRTKVAKKSFSKTFKAAQLINFCVMYDNFDFERRKMTNFQNKFLAHNELLDGPLLIKEEKLIKQAIGFDCEKEAREFPLRPKMKICGIEKVKRLVDAEVSINNASDSLESYLIIVIKTMRDNYRFSKKNVYLWWEKFKEVAQLYADGMTDEFVVKYIEETLEWELKKI